MLTAVVAAAFTALARAAVSVRDAPTVDSCTFNASSGDWNTGVNWSCGHAPTTVDTVTVGSGKTAQLAAAGHAGDLTLSGGTIQFTAAVTLDVNGTMSTTGGTLDGGGTITVAGHFSKTTSGQLTMNNVELALNDASPTGTELSGGQICLNSGSPVLHLTHAFAIASGADPNAFNCAGGHIQIDAGAELTSSAAGPFVISTPVQNAGTIAVASGRELDLNGGLSQTGGTTTVAAGATLGGGPDKNVSGGTFTADGTVTGTIVLTGGILDGNGQTASVMNTAGTVAPGSSPGTLTISGSYSQGPAGTLTAEITGTTPGTQFDRLLVTGTVSLDGTLAIQSGGFTPATTDTFKIIGGASSRSGTFAALTGTNAGGNVYGAQYDADGVTLLVNGTPPSNSVPPSIPSAGHPGDVVTCDPGTWAGSPTFTFVWTRDGTAIDGQAAQTYTLAGADVGHAIRCSVTGHNAAGDSAPAGSNGLTVLPFAPTNSTPPSIPSSGHPGDQVTCNPGSWTSSPTFTFAWTSDGTQIAGQASQTYTLAAVDASHQIRCRVTGHNPGGDSAPIDSNGLAVTVIAPANSGAPTIPSSGHAGDQVTCTPGTWTGSPSFTFAWTRDGTVIAGQSAQTYTLADADATHAIRCRVTGHNAGGDSAPVDSNALNATVAVPRNTAAPSIPTVGHPGDLISCSPGTWTGSPTFTFAWLRDGIVLAGKASQTYTVSSNDLSQQLRCRVTGHNAGGDGTPADSNVLLVTTVSARPSGECAICILGPGSKTNLHAIGPGSITARGGPILINGRVAVSGSGRITAPAIGIFPRASTKPNFSPRAVALTHAVADPLASRALPSVDVPCQKIRHSAAAVTLHPGVYCGLEKTKSTFTLTPGLYVFTGRINVGEKSTLRGDGVTIYLTCTHRKKPCKGGEEHHGSLHLSTHSVLDISAPGSGRYRGIALYFDRKNDDAFELSGDSTATVDGAIYGKDAGLHLSGDAVLACTDSPIAVGKLSRSGHSRVVVRPGVF